MLGTLQLPQVVGPAPSPAWGSHGNHGLDKPIPMLCHPGPLCTISTPFCLLPCLSLLTSHLLVLATPVSPILCQPQKETLLILSSGRRTQVSIPPRTGSFGPSSTLLVLGRGTSSLTSPWSCILFHSSSSFPQ